MIKVINYRRLHEIILTILILGLLNIYETFKNINISINEGIIIEENKIMYLILITLFFFFIFYKNSSHNPSMELELILGLGLIGLLLLLISNDLMIFFLSLELYSLSVYLLVFKDKKLGNQSKISLIYFLIGSISSSLILLGISLFYLSTGSLNLNFILDNFDTILKYHENKILEIGIILIFIGILFKLGAAPFQFWVLRVYSHMDIKILLYQSILPKIVYIIILMEILNKYSSPELIKILLLASILSLIIGSIGPITYNVFYYKTIIAYSSILHVGYLLLGLAAFAFFSFSNTSIIFLNIFQYLFIYGINTFQFILGLILLNFIFKSNYNFNKNILYISFLISIFSFIGLPPFAGFYAKLNIILNAYYTANPFFYFSIFIILISTLLASFLYLKFFNNFYFKVKEIKNYFNQTKTSTVNFNFFLFSFLTIFLFTYPLFLPYLTPFYEYLII